MNHFMQFNLMLNVYVKGKKFESIVLTVILPIMHLKYIII